MLATTSPTPPNRRIALAALVTGVALVIAYVAYVLGVPRGPSEFGYAPFGPEPLPYSPMRGFTYEQLWGHVARIALLGPGLLLVTLGLWRLRPVSLRTTSRRVAVAAGVLGSGIVAFVMFGVLRGRAIIDDELVYRMQATFYAAGRLTGPDVGLTPPDVFTIHTRLGYTGKYLPGEGLVQVLGVWAGVPALLHLPLFVLSLFAWHRAVTLRAGSRLADFATVALALSPMVLLTAATGLSEMTSLGMVALAGLGLEWARGPRPYAGAALAALALDFGVAARPQSVAPAGAVLGLALAWSLVRQRRWWALGLFALLAAAGAAALGLYDWALSGSPWKLPWYLHCVVEHYGFGRVWKYDTFEHTPWTALENLGVVAVRLNAWWLGLPWSLAVLGLAVWLRIPWRAHAVWWGVAAAIVAFEFFYYSPGASDTGSLYHHELVLPGSLVAAYVADALLARVPVLASTGLVVCGLFGTLGFTAEQTARLARLVTAIHADSDRALARMHTPALLFYATRSSEVLRVGWVLESFPERFRGRSDAIVTFPNLPADERARMARAYPGRACYYYHRDPATTTPELLRCEDARVFMDRPYGRDDERPLWIQPTAYKLTSFDPLHANALRHVRDAQGRRIVTCCAVRDDLALGAKLDPELSARCVEDGP